jgi:antirestriction protein ArdC
MTGRLTPQQAAAQRRERLEALHAQLTEQVDKLSNSRDWRNMLMLASKLRSYSFRNLCLINAQREDVTRVAGYRAWQALGRQVRKGEPGIQILAPLRGRQEVEDTETGQRSTVPVLRGFKIEHVWDIKQTDGPPVPDLRPKLLEGNAPAALWDAVVRSFDEDGYRVVREEVPYQPTANGELVPSEHLVRIHPDLGPFQALKTLLHERSHLSLGHMADLDSYWAHRGRDEAEAESTAFVIAGAWGLDTAAYSVPYVAHWAKNDHGLLIEIGEHVVDTAHETIERLSPTLSLDGHHLSSLADSPGISSQGLVS